MRSTVAIALVSVALSALALTPARSSEPVAHAACGVERWPEKTLQDARARRVNFKPVRTTVDRLRRIPVSRDAQGYRKAPVETTTYRVRARLVSAKSEDDGDVHLVIASLTHVNRTMIVEFPSASCMSRASATAKRKMRAAHTSFDRHCGSTSGSFHALRGTATIDGVGFFDFIHGQTGVAPNGIELHPVIRFAGGCG